MVWTEVISFGLGVVLRLFNEHAKQKKDDHKLQMAIATKNFEILEAQRDRVVGSSFMQTMMMIMVLTALGALVAFPIIAAFGDIPLFILHEYVKETGFLFWRGTQVVTEWMTIEGLYLPVELQVLVIEATKFVFGAVVGGIGRR